MSSALTTAVIQKLIEPYGVAVDATLAERIATYVSQLLRWNRKMSLTAITDPLEIVRRHFGESFFAIPTVPFSGGRLADVGSGAGFPGAAIALLSPQTRVTLIESNSKKAAFLETIRSELSLANLEVVRARFRDSAFVLSNAEFVTARALGHYMDLLEFARTAGKATVKVIFWLGESDAIGLQSQLNWKWRPIVRIPDSDRRVLLIGSPAGRSGNT